MRAVRSRHSPETIEAYRVCHRDEHGKKYGKRWGRWTLRTGLADDAIDDSLEEIEAERMYIELIDRRTKAENARGKTNDGCLNPRPLGYE